MQPLATSIHSVTSLPSWLTVRGFSMSVALEDLLVEYIVDAAMHMEFYMFELSAKCATHNLQILFWF